MSARNIEIRPPCQPCGGVGYFVQVTKDDKGNKITTGLYAFCPYCLGKRYTQWKDIPSLELGEYTPPQPQSILELLNL